MQGGVAGSGAEVVVFFFSVGGLSRDLRDRVPIYSLRDKVGNLMAY